MRIKTLTAAAAGAAVLLAGTACGGGASEPAAAAPTAGAATSASAPAAGAAAHVTGSITVLAAASLTGAFTRIGQDFEAAHPGTKVTFSFGASSTLADQIVQGAPADVFASASPATMKQVTDAGDASGNPATFVKNQLVIAVPKGDPKGITSLADLAEPGIKVVECAAQVPCGAAAAKALAAANVKLTPVSLEADVKSTLAKLTLGEADAALVYRTDALSVKDKVDGLEFPESAQAVNEYPIVRLAHSAHAGTADAFVAFVESAPEISVLIAAGFQKP